MKRRTFIKRCGRALVGLIGLIGGLQTNKTLAAKKKPEDTKSIFEDHCWVETMSPNPEEWPWHKAKRIINDYDANNHVLGTCLITRDGIHYQCWLKIQNITAKSLSYSVSESKVGLIIPS